MQSQKSGWEQSGGVLAILGVIAAPITSGDTAFRSARLIVADFLGLEQKSMRRRLYICIPMFVAAIGLLLYSLRDANGFNMIWRYFAWANQTLAVFTLWAITVYLAVSKKPYVITLIPALFMTSVCSTYICIAPEGLGLSHAISYYIGVGCGGCYCVVLCLAEQAENKKIIRMKKIKKINGVALAFLIYVSVTAAYLLPPQYGSEPDGKVSDGGGFLCHCPASLACPPQRNRCVNAVKRRTIYSLKKVSL